MQTPEINSSEFSAVKHPTREQWMEYLYGEMPRAVANAVRTHLKTCPACREQYGAWAEMKSRLSHWRLGNRTAVTAEPNGPAPALKWAWAALIVLGLGYGVGRFSAPRVSLDAVRAAIESDLEARLSNELRQQVRQDVRGDWLAALGGNTESLNSPFRRELREGLEDWKTQTVSAGTAEGRRLMLGFAEQYRANRQEDQQAVLALFTRAEEKHQAEHLQLRRDVETVAVVADDQFQRTDSRIGELASFTQAKLTVAAPGDHPQPLNINSTKGNY
jgi:hypothetical protein